MKKLRVLFVLVMALALIAGCAHTGGVKSAPPPELESIKNKGQLVVGTTGSMPPFNMITREGELIGLDIDIARFIAEGMGVKVKFETMAFAELLPALEAGKVDMVISSMTITPKRNLDVVFVGPYFISGKGLLTKIGTLANAKNPVEVNKPGVKLTALKGSTSQVFVEKILDKTEYLPAGDYEEAVLKVVSGDAHAMVADYPFCIVAVFRYPDEDLLTIVTPFTYEPLGIAVRSADPHLINWLNNFIAILEGSGNLEELKERWFGNASWLLRLP
jgi:polar amino acid transport system substrate-binding protein